MRALYGAPRLGVRGIAGVGQGEAVSPGKPGVSWTPHAATRRVYPTAAELCGDGKPRMRMK